ncbi:MAG: hypothetical protein AB7U75_20980 [Hyphomicrobiaceae bacterium]
MTEENEAEAHGPPTPLEILSTNLHLHRSVMRLLMQGPWHMMSPTVVQQYLQRRPDMAARVDAWRRAGQHELARRKEQRLVVWREEQRKAHEKQEEERRVTARRLALSRLTGLTLRERFDQNLAERLLAAAAQESDAMKRVDLISEAFALLAG